MSSVTSWKQRRDPLHRGDGAESVSLPEPAASESIVRHILVLEGFGRKTPYLSTTESEECARRFAGPHGRVWTTRVARAKEQGVGHISSQELLELLRGTGKGAAQWKSALEVAQARRYVEESDEHLLDFRPLIDRQHEEIAQVVVAIFERTA